MEQFRCEVASTGCDDVIFTAAHRDLGHPVADPSEGRQHP
jgi:hypothetical protein